MSDIGLFYVGGAGSRSPLHQYILRLRLESTVPRDPDAQIVLPLVRAIYSLFLIPRSSPYKIVGSILAMIGVAWVALV